MGNIPFLATHHGKTPVLHRQLMPSYCTIKRNQGAIKTPGKTLHHKRYK